MPAIHTSATQLVAVNDTELAVERRGPAGGPAVLLIHGGGEDASTLAAQAASLADARFDVVSYDRRGTGRSGRDSWPGGGAGQHADDAAALLEQLGLVPAIVVGVSSGAVIALDLAARHPGVVAHAVAWEPPAAGLLEDGPALTAAIMAPVHAHLEAQPGDWVGAQAVLLSAMAGFPVTVDDPAFAGARANAEAMVRDEPTIILRRFDPTRLAAAPLTVAVGSDPNPIIAGAVEQLSQLRARPPVRLVGEHEVYLTDPSVLTDLVRRVGGRWPLG